MALRKTESSIPGGFTLENAQKLGQAVLGQNCVLVSYLQSPLRFSIKKGEDSVKHFDNTYVVFIDESQAGVRSPVTYNWNIGFHGQDQADNPVVIEKTKKTEIGELHLNMLDLNIYDDLDGVMVSKLFVRVDIDGLETPLCLEQSINDLDADIEGLVTEGGENGEALAAAGDPEITRWLANDFKSYLIELDKKKYQADDNNVVDISIFLVASVLYGALQDKRRLLSRMGDSLFGTDEEKWIDYIEAGAGEDIDSLIDTRIGITNVKPHILNFFVFGPGDDVVNSKNEDVDDYEERILEGNYFQTVTTYNEKIDLFNKLRFPKSCLELTWEFLKKLKNRNDTWSAVSLDKNSHIHNRDCITTIVSEFETAPQTNLEEPTDYAKKAYNIMYSRWMQAILQTCHAQFETIMIKILDIRSGKPIKNGSVRRLTITRTGINPDTGETVTDLIDTDFESINNAISDADDKHNWKKLNIGSIKLRSQWALWYLGYDPNGPTAEYKETGRRRYKEYWDARVLDGSVEAIDEGKQPPEYMLLEIIEEYNNHRATDENGILNVRVPTNYLEVGQVQIDVGFMEFPVVCEALADDDRDEPISRIENTEGATNFKISFIGNDASNIQNLNWDDNVRAQGHFGWTVSDVDGDKTGVLRFAQRLNIKTDYDSFDGFDSDILSRFFDQDLNPIHFVLFGMQWCQPVWDEFDDSLTITDSTYVQRNENANIHMHLVTLCRDLGGSDIYGGKGYGKRDHQPANSGYQPKWRGDNGHSGLDLYGKIGDPVFAIHGGKTNSHELDFVGKIVDLDWDGDGLTFTQYMHLRENDVVESNTYVLSGTIIGKIGRTGSAFEPEPSEWPTHVHLWVTPQNVPGETVELRNTPDALNQICIPNNDTSLVFPCKCHVPKPERDPANCNFSNVDFVHNQWVTRGCWAVADLKCPKMYEKGRNDVFRLQAQLRYLNEKPTVAGDPFKENNNPYYLHPGPVDGDDGGLVQGGQVNLVIGNSIKPHRLDAADDSWKDNSDPKYRRVIEGDKIGWVLYSDLEGTYDSASDSYILNKNIPSFLHGGLKRKEFSQTRKAIFHFRDKARKPDGTNYLKSGGENNWENYQIGADENDVWARLDGLAPITQPVIP
ncbi:MAG: M23 family metallopeptidase [Anaerolineales bacterium]|nr:M23 family metallopeptidase [Anaerolineales bacterium]